ncbi:Aste57867_8193 [Aphanomyces stellatus]|uniref:Aste57867_8193 protein n=1 Tax=Aphanomyces stellatus TaxID=120398 RepID=A0A485KJR5_9STRA|nr:hypothetical protein As57867_008162 [Aphanomyces stellatus]VFT85081.1 Aste57867_8193 [Aphanomyces stellatus]
MCSTQAPRCAVAGPNNSPLMCCATTAGCCSSGSALLDCCKPPPLTTLPGPMASTSSSSSSSGATTGWVFLAAFGVLLAFFVPWSAYKRYKRKRLANEASTDFVTAIETASAKR